MSFAKIEVSLASAVATSGTFTASYPALVTGYAATAGDFAAYGHKMFSRGLQAMFKQDDGQMSVSFGASDITVTYLGSTSIPAGTVVDIQFNMAGTDNKQLPDISAMKRMNWLSPILIDLGAPDAADDNGIAESQSVTGAGTAFVLNGVYADPYSGLKAFLDVPRALVAAWTGTAVLTITGKDEYGDVIVETSASGTSHTGKKAFKEINSITTSASITSATVGTGDVLGLPVYVDKISRIVAELKDGVVLPAVKGGKYYLMAQALEAAVDGGTGYNLVSPVAGHITRAWTIVQASVTTGGAVTAEINTVAINGLSVTIANSAAEGEVDVDTSTRDHASTAVEIGDRIEVQFAAAIDGSADMQIVIEVEATYALHGTFVAGVQTTPTGTTGDVKGTYDPASACDGALSFGLMALLPDPTYKGVDNYDG